MLPRVCKSILRVLGGEYPLFAELRKVGGGIGVEKFLLTIIVPGIGKTFAQIIIHKQGRDIRGNLVTVLVNYVRHCINLLCAGLYYCLPC